MQYLEIALPASMRHTLFYLPPEGVSADSVKPGTRVLVPVGRSRRIGILIGLSGSSPVAINKMRPVLSVIDREPLFTEAELALLLWASRYYHFPPGDVIAGAMPVLLRKGRSLVPQPCPVWRLTDAGKKVDPDSLGRAVRQSRLLGLLRSELAGLEQAALGRQVSGAASVLKTFSERGWVEESLSEVVADGPIPERAMDSAPQLTDLQQICADALLGSLDSYTGFLLDGVTGSGKTEVYLQVIAQVLEKGQQTLILLPEIGLAPQMLSRVSARFAVSVVAFHSGMSDGERLQSWVKARSGEAKIVIGTRSAVWTPMPNLGLIVVDEEHDRSFKQHEGFRYHARDIAVLRAQRSSVPVVLGSATPSLESLYNVQSGRYQRLHLPERTAGAKHPSMQVLDVRAQQMSGNLSAALIAAMHKHLAAGTQVLLFLNRRGFAPVLMCHDCGWMAHCHSCDANLTVHSAARLWCHHCGAMQGLPEGCADCGSEQLLSVGYGTQRVEQILADQFPDQNVIRIDRDSVSRKGAFDRILQRIHEGDASILIGTQMLAKGHHFPKVTLVGIVDADAGLFSTDFRSSEEMAQLIIQTAGRGGREQHPGEVFVQTHHPDHPLLETLINKGYAAFAEAALAERAEAGMPPFGCLAMLRADSPKAEVQERFLEQAKALLQSLPPGIGLWGPVPAPMYRRAGRYRGQLLVQAGNRGDMQRFLGQWMPGIEGLKVSRSLRWAIDVDPQNMF